MSLPSILITFYKRPGILLGNVQEVSLHNLPIKELNNPLLLEELRDMYDLLTENGVLHGDPRLHNFLRVHQRIVAIDFELSEPLTSEITNEHGLESLEDDIKRRVRGTS